MEIYFAVKVISCNCVKGSVVMKELNVKRIYENVEWRKREAKIKERKKEFLQWKIKFFFCMMKKRNNTKIRDPGSCFILFLFQINCIFALEFLNVSGELLIFQLVFIASDALSLTQNSTASGKKRNKRKLKKKCF